MLRLPDSDSAWEGSRDVSLRHRDQLVVALYHLEKKLGAMESRIVSLEKEKDGLRTVNRAVVASTANPVTAESEEGGI